MPRFEIPAHHLQVGHVISHTAYGLLEVSDVKFTDSQDPKLRIRVESGGRVIFFAADRMVKLVPA